MKKRTTGTIFLLVLLIALFVFISAGFKQIPANVEQSNEVYLCGFPIGIVSKANGLTVTEIINVTTQSGSFSPALESGIRRGDFIRSANGIPVQEVMTLNEIIASAEGDVTLEVERGNHTLYITVIPADDIVHGDKKIGIAVKNTIVGIGTMTYVMKNGRYGALGHAISDGYGNEKHFQLGEIFPCEITGYKRASNDIPGELMGKILLDKKPIGTIQQNRFCGIFGEINENISLCDHVELGSKQEVIPGKAAIFTTIEGNKPSIYEIEIVKTQKQNKPSEKGMVIRITDKRLLETTGGILQGMSGSPIIQNNKLVGAVTHVFTDETRMGYGIYIDWMMKTE